MWANSRAGMDAGGKVAGGGVSDGLSDDWNMMMSLAAGWWEERHPLLVLPPQAMSGFTTRNTGHVITASTRVAAGRTRVIFLLGFIFATLFLRCYE